MTRFLGFLCYIAALLNFVFLTAMVVIMISLVITRYFFSYSAPWSEELTRFSMVWMVMLGSAVLVLFEDHIALYLLQDYMSSTVRKFQRFFVRLLIFAISLVLIYTGYRYALSMNIMTASGSGLSMVWPTLAVPVGASLMAFFSLILLWNSLAEFFKFKPVELPAQKLFMDGSFKPLSEE